MEKLLTMREAADLIGITREELRGIVSRGGLSYYDYRIRGNKNAIRRFALGEVEALQKIVNKSPKYRGSVYVVGFDDYIKIGWASNFETRRNLIEISVPMPIQTYSTFPGGRKLERELLRRFSAYRTRGEWFRKQGELADWVKEGCPL